MSSFTGFRPFGNSMVFQLFSTATTNVYPMANTVHGGQLNTEFNLRSRESVGVGPFNHPAAVDYMIGPSYVHSDRCFEVRPQSDGLGNIVESAVLEILPGRAVLNGHYVEQLAPMMIDLRLVNLQARTDGTPPLRGDIRVGLRAMYSTISTMAGTVKPENEEEVYQGIVVVLANAEDFILPVDSPHNPDAVTAHIELARFHFANGVIAGANPGGTTSSIINNPDKGKIIDGERIGNINNIISSIFVRKTGLNPKRLYVFAGKGSDPQTGHSTWCDAVTALAEWHNGELVGVNELTDRELAIIASGRADFRSAPDGRGAIFLDIPPKQIEYDITATDGMLQVYRPRSIPLPVADFNRMTAGTVDRTYTQNVREISDRIHTLFGLQAGTQRMFIPRLDFVPGTELSTRERQLPPINPLWNFGDYVLVGEDNTLGVDQSNAGLPSTMYVVLPGYVTELRHHATLPGNTSGAELGTFHRSSADGPFPTTAAAIDASEFVLTSGANTFRGAPGSATAPVDFFRAVFTDTDTDTVTTSFYRVSQSGPTSWSTEPIHLTGEIPLATEQRVGGFLNVPETVLDQGLVHRDNEGHLRLLDYSLLRSGVLAWQLGENFQIPAGQTTEVVQTLLNEFVNNRVAFPNARQTVEQRRNGKDPSVIHITLDLTQETVPAYINIHGIDSRFGTSIYLHINGTANHNTIITVSDVEKLRIDPNVSGTPVINVVRCGLYYDAEVLDRTNAIDNMTLWYERYNDTDPPLQVDGMTVSQVGMPVLSNELNFWTEVMVNDNHFKFGLRSLTFANNGEVIGIDLLVSNQVSANVALIPSVVTAQFEIPATNGLIFPRTRILRRMKVTGTFVTAYVADQTDYMIISSDFSALTQIYNPDGPAALMGTIAFYTDPRRVSNILGLPAGTPIDAWENGAWHIFSGGVIA